MAGFGWGGKPGHLPTQRPGRPNRYGTQGFGGVGYGMADPKNWPKIPTAPPPQAAQEQAQAGGQQPDPNLEAQRASANLGINLGNAWDTYQQGRIEQDYGLNDTSDPFAKAALLQQTYQNSRRGNTNSMAAQGQLYSGALQNAQAGAERSYNQGYDQLKRGRQDALDQLLKGKLDRYSQVGANLDENTLASLLAALGVK